ncbi:DNA-binding protein [Candidatus Parcubacteria bacterium]|nr:MAG: DNA-binding protein [Candidatus Parcubacteria bacterium]
MSEKMTIEGENLISSKRAAELSGYAQDYIGQLARKSLIEGKRIGGLWYVSLESLNGYKSRAELYTPRPPQTNATSSEHDSVISFDGRDYVSAARAAKITGYNPDYVGQLARSGKVLSRQIGNRWYVDREELVKHKSEKDALLGAVQAEAVGVSHHTASTSTPRLSSEPFFTYRTDGQDLIPRPSNPKIGYKEIFGEHAEEDRKKNPISIREQTVLEEPSGEEEEEYTPREPRAGNKRVLWTVLMVGATAIVAAGMFFVFKKDAPGSLAQNGTVNVRVGGPIETISDFFNRLLGKELVYKKGK